MIIEKKTVIKALRTEPLAFGLFFGTGNVKTCNVCAVGAVVRSHMNKKLFNKNKNSVGTYCALVTDGKYIWEDIDELLYQKNYLGALSTYFESKGVHTLTVSPKVRKDLVEFVRQNFPTRFKVKDFE